MYRTSAAVGDRIQGRSMVISRYGIVAAESPLAAQAGAQILERGGNAVDAAVAANAMMGLVAPMSNGVGGDLFAIVYVARSGKLHGLNASGWAASGMTIPFLEQKGIRTMPKEGIHTVTVPGAVDGWQKLMERFGTMKLSEVLNPAIHASEEGFPVTEWVSGIWSETEEKLRKDPAAAHAFLPSGKAPVVGQVFRNADLAHTLRVVARGGRDSFYKGEIARRIIETSRVHRGQLTEGDFADYSSEWVEPVSTTYHGWTVYELPPNGQGVAALEMLNIMEAFPLSQYGLNSVMALHIMIEAKKLAYADLVHYMGDPRFSELPIAEITSKEHAARRARQIDPDKASCHAEAGNLPHGGDTVYLSVVDQEGNIVSLIQSNYDNFGSGLVPAGSGFALQNRGALFSLDPASPNALAPRKRPLHTIIPGFVEKGDLRIAFGIMGGWNQSQAQAQFVSHIVDFDQNIQAAMETARFTKLNFEGCDVEIEDRLPAGVVAGLEAKGHMLRLHHGFGTAFGGGQAVMRDSSTGVNYGASDPRKDGQAIPALPLSSQ